ncbi:MAG: hypothetical protein KDI79_07115, partial [Anaerolineae bacterium]|nr:hypothetical protein [Anaerolineae bacterium]
PQIERVVVVTSFLSIIAKSKAAERAAKGATKLALSHYQVQSRGKSRKRSDKACFVPLSGQSNL